ncbi:hypothetical protein ACX9NE_25005 [Mycobacterium sp. ML4]
MNSSQFLLASALLQAGFGVVVGWPLAVLRAGWIPASPETQKRVLQCHLDNLFMAALQFGLAATVSVPIWVAALIVIGSWTNAQLFLIPVFSPRLSVGSPWIAVPSLLSFITITAGWLAAVVLSLQALTTAA